MNETINSENESIIKLKRKLKINKYSNDSPLKKEIESLNFKVVYPIDNIYGLFEKYEKNHNLNDY